MNFYYGVFAIVNVIMKWFANFKIQNNLQYYEILIFIFIFYCFLINKSNFFNIYFFNCGIHFRRLFTTIDAILDVKWLPYVKPLEMAELLFLAIMLHSLLSSLRK